MITGYFFVKIIHILIAILALGTSAGLGIVLEFYGDHPTHGLFVLRAIERIENLFVIPGYVLMLATGLWMAHLFLAVDDPELYFIMITANGNTDLAVEALKQGASDFMTKPFFISDLVKSIDFVNKKRELDR